MILPVALAQMDISFGAPAANLDTVRPLAAAAAARGAQLLVLPELWTTGYALDRAVELAAPPDAGVHAELAALARAQGIAIVGSTLMQRKPGHITNAATLYDATGTLHASYDKLHLFGLMNEPAHLQPGDTPIVCDLPWGRTALAICYDLRFPELFRSYALQGAVLIIVPAEWPTTRLHHWRTLVQARAIENQCFVVAVNRVGSDLHTEFGGHSMVVDPQGTVLAKGGDSAELLFAQLDLASVEATRQHIPVLRDRRPAFYGKQYD